MTAVVDFKRERLTHPFAIYNGAIYFRLTSVLTKTSPALSSLLYYSNVNVLRNDNNVARVKSKRIETSICSIINIKLSKPIFGLPMNQSAIFWA